MKAKRTYRAPKVSRAQIDKDISMVMMSSFGPTGDPEARMLRSVNPLKWFR
jgi:hypothetical protein